MTTSPSSTASQSPTPSPLPTTVAPAQAVAPSSDPNRQRAQALAAVAILSLIAALACFHQTPGQTPAPMPATQAQPWMADCLPRIGDRTRTRMAEALRNDDLDRLPAPARTQATRWFTW